MFPLVESCSLVSEPIRKHIHHLVSTVTVPPPELITVKLEYITELISPENHIKVQSVVPKCVILKQMNEYWCHFQK